MSGVAARTHGPSYRLTWTQQADQRLVKMREQGASLRDIARAFSLSRSVITARARKMGLEIPSRPMPVLKPIGEPSDNREALPAGHPISWELINKGTSLEGNIYTPPEPVRGRASRQNQNSKAGVTQ